MNDAIALLNQATSSPKTRMTEKLRQVPAACDVAMMRGVVSGREGGGAGEERPWPFA